MTTEKTTNTPSSNNNNRIRLKEIKDPRWIENLKYVLFSHWPTRHRQQLDQNRFPAPQPVSIERKDLYKLDKFDYVVCEKTNGIRYIMMCVRYFNKKICVMVNRALRFFFAPVNFSDEAYFCTILDGELVKNEGKWTFCIHDSVIVKGNNCGTMEHTNRIISIQQLLKDGYKYNEKHPFSIETKMFYMRDQVEGLMDSMKGRNTDGLIFTPIKLPVGTGTQFTLFKWKERDGHTFDFLVEKHDKDFECSIFNRGSMESYYTYKNEDRNKYYDEYVRIMEDKEKAIVEFSYDMESEDWKPLFIRTDKNYPNGKKTVEKTLLNIQENILATELY